MSQDEGADENGLILPMGQALQFFINKIKGDRAVETMTRVTDGDNNESEVIEKIYDFAADFVLWSGVMVTLLQQTRHQLKAIFQI